MVDISRLLREFEEIDNIVNQLRDKIATATETLDVSENKVSELETLMKDLEARELRSNRLVFLRSFNPLLLSNHG